MGKITKILVGGNTVNCVVMTPYPHQIEIAEQGVQILSGLHILYLAMEERTGKTLTSLLICEKLHKNILIVTKKKALDGWKDTLSKFPHNSAYTLINYESLHKLKPTKYDCVICDEAHYRLAAFPKPSVTCKLLFKIVGSADLILLSATPSAQSLSQLYHQFKLSAYTPFAHKNFYDWHRKYGIPSATYLHGRVVNSYEKTREDLVRSVTDKYFISYTRSQLSFVHEPQDVLHYVELHPSIIKGIKQLDKESVLGEYLADTPTKRLTGMHQLEGGTLKFPEGAKQLKHFDKIEYIKRKWGDTDQIGIFHNYVAEGDLLRQHFKNANIYSASAFAEGVDLSHIDTLIVYSMNFSTAQYTQRRARQCNKERSKEIKVHYLLCKNLVSEQVYKCVAINKRNFVDKYFNRGAF